jgi:hypothetical protein
LKFGKELIQVAQRLGWHPQEIPDHRDVLLIISAFILGAFLNEFTWIGALPYSLLCHGTILRSDIHGLAGACKYAAVAFAITLVFRIMTNFWEIGEITRRVMAVKKWAALAVINAEGVFHASGGDIAIATQALEESAVGFVYYECGRTDDGAWYFKVFRFMGRLLAEVSC